MNIAKKYLFVCLANIDRSKTGEIFLRDSLRERGFSVAGLEEKCEADFYVGSAGVMTKEHGNHESRQYTSEMGDLADIIFVVDETVLCRFRELDSRNLGKVVQLDIPDVYKASEEVDYRMLMKLFHDKLLPYLPNRKQ